jgi:ABC-2 type transport system permease protein
MSYTFRLLRTLISTYYAYMVEYRAELVLWALSGSLPIILMGAWTHGAANGGNFGLTSIEFVRYFLVVFLIRQLTVVWVIWDFEKEVVQGTLSPKLLQPIDPVWHHVASHVGERFARLPFVVGLMALGFVLYPQAVWLPNPVTVGLFFAVIALTFTLRFLIQYTFALMAFWTERSSAIEQFWYLFYLFLSGLIAPLELFPDWLKSIVAWTPFPYTIYFPAAIAIGLPVDIPRGLMVMLGWIGIFLVVNRWLWRRGLKEYSGMGA